MYSNVNVGTLKSKNFINPVYKIYNFGHIQRIPKTRNAYQILTDSIMMLLPNC